MTTDITPPYHISLGTDPFDDVIEIEISTRGKHPTLGMHLNDNRNLGERMQLLDIASSSPAARIPRWRSTLRSSPPLSIDNSPVSTQQDLEAAIRTARQQDLPHVKIKFGLMQKTAMNPQDGVPIVFHDQLNIIAQHLTDIK